MLKREHKHIQESIQGEMSAKGIERLEGETPTYFVAYYLFAGAVAQSLPREYAAYEGPDRMGGSGWDRVRRRHARDRYRRRLERPASLVRVRRGQHARHGRGRFTARMRGVKEAVRHIMRDLE